MKAGDLVTLSAYANKLDALHQWSEYYRQVIKKTALVGLVIKAGPSRWGNRWMYEVRWMDDDGPKGRDGRYGGTHFNRKDLKFVSRG
jgi:hypothetical protein